MEALKSVVGFGKKEPSEDEGQEPVSGAQGEGTAAEPFDAGNSEEPSTSDAQSKSLAPDDRQEAVQQPLNVGESKSSAPPPSDSADNNSTNNKHTIGSPGWFRSAKPSSARDQGDPSGATDQSGALTTADQNGTDNKQQPVDSSPPSEDTQHKKTGVTSGWLKSAMPIGKKKHSSATAEQPQQPAQSEREEAEPEVKEADLAPNQLGEQVPVGQSADIAAPGEAAPGKTDDMNTNPFTTGAGKENTPMQPARDTTDNITPAPPLDTTTATEPGDDTTPVSPTNPIPDTVPGPRSSTLQGSRTAGNPPGEARGSITNHSSIPTAGGITVGQAHMEARARDREVDDDAPMPALDKEGSPDDQTAKNTASNAGGVAPMLPVVTKNSTSGASNLNDADSPLDDPRRKSSGATGGPIEKVKNKVSKLTDKIPDKLKPGHHD